MAPTATVLLLAGEASGDLYGGHLARELSRQVPGVELVGMGGPAMESAGVRLLAHLDDLAVMGIAEVVRHLGFFRTLERRLLKQMEAGGVDLVVPIDYPGFNMRIMRGAHARGLPVLWYVAPKVWAWKERRVKHLARCAQAVAAILPFEEEFLRSRGVAATYVGNPLMDRADPVQDRDGFCQAWGLDPSRPILGVLAGSRRQELARHVAPFAEVVAGVVAARPDVQPIMARAAHLPDGLLEPAGLPVIPDVRDVQRHADIALVKSGTATLETALEGTPFVMAYRTSPLTWAIVKRAVQLDHWALANLVAGERVVPEFVQDEMSVPELVQALLEILDEDSPQRRHQLAGMERIRARVGGPGAAAKVAGMAAEILDGATRVTA